MWAIVLVGGFGTRLRPLTLDTPKQMLPVGDKTMIECVLARLGQQGITDAVLSLGYRPDSFREAFPNSRCAGVRITYAQEPTPLDTAGAIRFAADAAGIDETCIVVNGDVLTSLDVRELLHKHDRARALASIHLIPVEDPSRYGVVSIDDDYRVREFVEKPAKGTAPSSWINAGTYVLEPEVLRQIPTGRRVSIERETFPELAAAGDLFAFPLDEYWLDAGTRATYLQANLDIIHRDHNTSIVAPSANLGPDVEIDRSVVGAGAQIGKGARIIDSVILPRAVIEPMAWIEGSIVGSRTVVGQGARVASLTVIGSGQRVGAGAVLERSLVPNESEWPKD